MKLYHGTSERHLAAILKDGLKPRGKRKGNWTHTVESNNEAVYLTNAYALYFADAAVDPNNKGERLAVIEIDTDRLDKDWLAPDEDWLEQVSRKMNEKHLAPITKPMKYRTRWYRKRLLHFTGHWKDSLEGLGNCTYHDVIPPSAITRIAFVDQHTYHGLVFVAGIDPMISLMNYRIVGQKYRDSMKRLFGDTVEEAGDSFDGFYTEEQLAIRKAALEEVWSKGIEVRVLQ